MRIAFVGHVCLDVNVVRGSVSTLAGGGVVHGAITASRLGAEATVVTRCRAEDRARFGALADASVRVVFLPGKRTTSIRNEYRTDNPDDRYSILGSTAEPFAAGDLAVVDADVLHVNPLWAGEFPSELIPEAKRHAATLGGDAQGFLRAASPADGLLAHRPWADMDRWLPFFDVFKADASEARSLTGSSEPAEAARRLRDAGPRTVLVTHKGGVFVAAPDGLHEAAFAPYPMEGRTGRGDTFTAAFLVASGRMDAAGATTFAAEVTSRKLQYAGPSRETIDPATGRLVTLSRG